MPFLEKMVSATPSAALEQLVPITDRSLGSAASLVAPDCPPSFEQVSSVFTSSMLCPMSWPGLPSSFPSRLSTASTTPRWLSTPRLRLSPVIDSSVPILIGSPDAQGQAAELVGATVRALVHHHRRRCRRSRSRRPPA